MRSVAGGVYWVMSVLVEVEEEMNVLIIVGIASNYRPT